MSSMLPQHIAIIMDGNGRWAKKRYLPRLAGHRAGMEAAKKIVECCVKRKIPVLSLFAFSSENWRRSNEEVSDLMNLFLSALQNEMTLLTTHQVQLRFIGDRSKFDEKLIYQMNEVETLTQSYRQMILMIAIDYGGQWDIVQAVKRIASQVETGRIKSQDITPHDINQNLSFSDLPHPDLFIRTSGEMRISNFMLWQIAYAELYFTPILWPDFNEAELDQALAFYAMRERRYGGRTTCLEHES